jgi:uncharacterized membrane protein YedE/YeeE
MIFADRLPWFVAGPAIGLLVVALYTLANRRLGVTQSYVQVYRALQGRPVTEAWRLWLFAGMAAGALAVALLRGGPVLSTGYGALGALLPMDALMVLLLAGGVLMGFGARWAGGCTSGHGISGNSGLSPASFVATGTFMVTAIAVTLAIHLLTGGAL